LLLPAREGEGRLIQLVFHLIPERRATQATLYSLG
jgi:hypothetical protein